MRSKGADALRAIPKTQAEKADAIGVSRNLVAFWERGERTPSPKWQAAICSAFGIPIPQWGGSQAEQPPAPLTTRRPPQLDDVPDVDPGDVVGGCKAQLVRLAKQRSETEDPRLLARLEEIERATRHSLSLYLGEGRVISEAVLLRSPAFQRVLAKIVSALQDHPDALLAVTEALGAEVD